MYHLQLVQPPIPYTTKKAKYIKFLLDSQAALKANSVKSKTVQRTIRELSQLGIDIPRLALAWIKAQVGYEGNKLADIVAKQGALEPDMSNIPILRTEISNKLKELIHNKWKTSIEYKHSKHFLDRPNSICAKKIMQLPRLKMKRLIEILTGHNNLSYYRHKVDPDPPLQILPGTK